MAVVVRYQVGLFTGPGSEPAFGETLSKLRRVQLDGAAWVEIIFGLGARGRSALRRALSTKAVGGAHGRWSARVSCLNLESGDGLS